MNPVMTGERATKKQQQLLEFVDGFIRDHGYGPSYREVMSALGYKSVSTVAVHVDGLIAKGYLRRKDNSARSLEVVGRTSEQETPTSQLVDEIERKLGTDISDEDRQTLLKTLDILGYESKRRQLEEAGKTIA